MNADELIQRHLDGRATAEDAAALAQALAENASARARYLEYMNLDVALNAAAEAATLEQEVLLEMPAKRSPSRWPWIATAAACVALALTVGLHSRHQRHPARPDLLAVVESAENAIAQMPAPAPPLPAWISPTDSLLTVELPRPSTLNSKQNPL